MQRSSNTNTQKLFRLKQYGMIDENRHTITLPLIILLNGSGKTQVKRKMGSHNEL